MLAANCCHNTAAFIIFGLILLGGTVSRAYGYCSAGAACRDCHLFTIGGPCQADVFLRNEYFHCDRRTARALLDQRAFLECLGGEIVLHQCPPFHRFSRATQRCEEPRGGGGIPSQPRPAEAPDTVVAPNELLLFDSVRLKRSSGSRTGDLCNFNTDCQSGMYCVNSVCACLSDYVAISGYCWPRVNPGDSGCVDDLQCEAVWPGSRCSRGGVCECPDYTLPSKTRDGVVCVTSGVPPACPLPEPNNPEAPNPATILANAHTHPLAARTYMPVLCTSSSTETERSNAGDGSTWCVYPDGRTDVHVADIYSCVPHPQVKPEFFPEYAPTVDGICCHSRAFVCIQPMEPGEEPSVPRWWYNSVTGTCTQFLWDPSQTDSVSPNNFRTVEHCESYCRDTCRRGAPQPGRNNRGTLLDEIPIANCLQQTGSCAPEFHCTLIGSHQHCCPTVGNICSAFGGRTAPFYAPAERYDAGVPIAGSRSVSRFYYDAEQGKCLSFVYDALGNFNNFLTKQDCDSYCAKLVCEYGNPLRIGEDWQRCERAADCPHSHHCDAAHKVCCPTAESICTQPKRHGDCTSSVQRFAYNAAAHQCEAFQYTGCQGNDNNFDSLLECQRVCRNVALEPKCPQGRAHRDANGDFFKCTLPPATGGGGGAMPCPSNYYCVFDGTVHGCCPTKAYTCSLGADRGVQCGAGRSFRHFFNAQRHACESFQFDGCDGNANNFQTLEQCQAFCSVGGCPNGGQPLRDAASGELATCALDSGGGAGASGNGGCAVDGYECVGINAGGGDGVTARCCPTKGYICAMPPQPGSACVKTAVTRWYFNIVTHECSRFSFNGCSGNLNNFASREQCVNFCSSAACAPGETTHKDPRTKTPTVCTPVGAATAGTSSGCPPDYRCTFDALAAHHVCCGSPQLDVCPADERPFLEALDEAPRECAANLPTGAACPTAAHSCRFSPAHNRYYCCAPRSGHLCPDGRALHHNPQTGRPSHCVLTAVTASADAIAAAAAVCPAGFTCQSRVPDVVQGFCCTAHEVCQNGAEFHVDEHSPLVATRCTPGGASDACPVGFHCLRYRTGGSVSATTDGYCCRESAEDAAASDLLAAGCPPGEAAFLRDEDGDALTCDPFNAPDKACPPRFTCQYALPFQRYHCCGPVDAALAAAAATSSSSGNEHGCLSGQVALLEEATRRPRLCTASAPNACPLGYFCQFSERNAQFQCCAHKAGCPRDSVAHIDMYGRPHACKWPPSGDSEDECPAGYACRRTRDHGAICCTAPSEVLLAGRTSALMELAGHVTDPTTTPTTTTITTALMTTTMAATTKLEATPMTTKSRTKPKARRVKTTTTATTTVSYSRRSSWRRCHSREKLKHGRCVARQLGERCHANRECPRQARCVRSVCRCPSGTRRRGRTHCVAAPATCPRGYFAQGARCLRQRSIALGAVCAAGEQCAVDAARCVAGRCRCTGGRVAHNGTCYANLCTDVRLRIPQINPVSSAAVRCALASPNRASTTRQQRAACTLPHECRYSAAARDYVCCRAPNTSTTAAIGNARSRQNATRTVGTAAIWHATFQSGRRQTSRPRSEPAQPWSHKRRRLCADGSRPLLTPGTAAPVKCDEARRLRCPRGHTCLHDICCRDTSVTRSTASSALHAPTRAPVASSTTAPLSTRPQIFVTTTMPPPSAAISQPASANDRTGPGPEKSPAVGVSFWTVISTTA